MDARIDEERTRESREDEMLRGSEDRYDDSTLFGSSFVIDGNDELGDCRLSEVASSKMICKEGREKR